MHKGNVDISHITGEMLYRLKFTQHTNTVYSAGFWDKLGVPVPDYPHDAPWVWQVFEDDCPPWVEQTKTLFPWLKYSVVTVNKLMPGCFIGPHNDTLYKLKKKVKDEGHETEEMEAYRINMFLQDRLMGHYFEMDGDTWLDYKRGDYTIIDPNKIHLVANLGYQQRFTMQITGYAKKEDIQ
jgi:hypothetical protein|tara:strand:+ start:575 stop:1117 length:543 start_codon:yes stop_codon:yes gene_type:complete